ncbi:MAG: dCMP deaminase [Alphaproteobacteria bacterium]|nr:dCMP deaminase [Alphaproteobacteria bacterium]
MTAASGSKGDAERDRDLMGRAAALADLCPPSETAFSVGCVIAAADGTVLSEGYSRERGPNWHAEEVALAKLRETGTSAQGATLYASLEPCGERKSGRTPCVDHILAAGIARVVYAADEPSLFVEGVGRERLRAAGVPVDHVSGYEDRFRHQNRHLFD